MNRIFRITSLSLLCLLGFVANAQTPPRGEEILIRTTTAGLLGSELHTTTCAIRLISDSPAPLFNVVETRFDGSILTQSQKISSLNQVEIDAVMQAAQLAVQGPVRQETIPGLDANGFYFDTSVQYWVSTGRAIQLLYLRSGDQHSINEAAERNFLMQTLEDLCARP